MFFVLRDAGSRISHAMGKMGAERYYSRIFIDVGNGVPIARSRNKAVLKASSNGNNYETLFVSTKSIVQAVQQSDLNHLTVEREVFLYPYPEWQGEPRRLVGFRRDDIPTGGDIIVQHDMDRGIFLKVHNKVCYPSKLFSFHWT